MKMLDVMGSHWSAYPLRYTPTDPVYEDADKLLANSVGLHAGLELWQRLPFLKTMVPREYSIAAIHFPTEIGNKAPPISVPQKVKMEVPLWEASPSEQRTMVPP